MRMFNGYEYGGRQLKVHHDKFLQSSLLNHPGLAMPSSLPNSTSTIPSMKPLSAMTSQNQMSVALPPGYRYDFIPPSGPSSPYEMQSMRMHSAQHHPNFSSQPRSTQQSQLPSPLGQHLHQGPSPKQPHFQVPSPLRDHSHSLLQPQPLPHHQHFSRIFGAGSSSAPTSSPATSKPSNSSRKDVDMDNLAQALGATRFLSSPAKSSTSRNILSQSYAESRFDSARQSSAISSSTSASGISPAISNAPSSSTASSSTSISSTPSTAPKSAPESAPSSAVSSGSGPTRASERHQTQERKLAQQNLRTHHMASTYQHQQYSQQQQHPSQQPQSYQQHAASRQHHHPGPISLPPVPHVSFPGSPHTPLGHGMSLSPLYHPSMGSPYHLYPTAYHHAYQQQHYQHTPLGLPITPSMPPFTFLAPNSGTSGPNNNAGDRAPSANDAKARDDGSKSRRSSASVSTEESAHSRQSRNVQAQPGASADAQRANTTVDSHSGAGDMIPNQIAGGGGVPIHTNPAHMHAAHHAHARAHAAAAAAHAHAHAQHMPQPSPMHMRLNLANVPGAFSPGVAMSPGTFFGRPGEMAAVANPFINPAVGAPVHHVPMATVGMNMNMMGVPLMAMGNVNMNMNMNVNMSVNAGGGEGGEGQGQRHDMAAPDGQGSGSAVMMGMNVPMGVPHGAYFYAMSSPKRAGTGAEPQGYFDPNYFPMALQQQQQHHGDAGVDTSDASNQPPSQFQEGGNTQTEGEAGASTNRAEDSNTHEPPTQDSESVNPWYAQYRENDAAGIVPRTGNVE
ncbi:hypothetical protein BJ165DRAFT_904829 [Panaeolus papilionaceus]|nr:hypothetical protein BJ165DRAFT_904829 [Panaeolus papilionaceus]